MRDRAWFLKDANVPARFVKKSARVTKSPGPFQNLTLVPKKFSIAKTHKKKGLGSNWRARGHDKIFDHPRRVAVFEDFIVYHKLAGDVGRRWSRGFLLHNSNQTTQSYLSKTGTLLKYRLLYTPIVEGGQIIQNRLSKYGFVPNQQQINLGASGPQNVLVNLNFTSRWFLVMQVLQANLRGTGGESWELNRTGLKKKRKFFSLGRRVSGRVQTELNFPARPVKKTSHTSVDDLGTEAVRKRLKAGGPETKIRLRGNKIRPSDVVLELRPKLKNIERKHPKITKKIKRRGDLFRKHISTKVQKRLFRKVKPDLLRSRLFYFKQTMPYTVNRFVRSGRYSAGLDAPFLAKRHEKYYYNNRTDGFFDLSYPETWREDVDAFNLTNKHVWRHSIMKLKKLSKFKDNLSVPKVQYSARRFSNKAYETLGHSHTSAVPYYLTTRTAEQLDYLTQHISKETGLQYSLPTYIHAAAPEEYGNYGYHHILNMGLGLSYSTLADGNFSDYFKENKDSLSSKLREARARLLLNYDFKDSGSLVTKETARKSNKEFIDAFENPTIFRQRFRSKRAWDLFEQSKKIGGRLELRDVSKTTSTFLKPAVSIYSDLLNLTTNFQYGAWSKTDLRGAVESGLNK